MKYIYKNKKCVFVADSTGKPNPRCEEILIYEKKFKDQFTKPKEKKRSLKK